MQSAPVEITTWDDEVRTFMPGMGPARLSLEVEGPVYEPWSLGDVYLCSA